MAIKEVIEQATTRESSVHEKGEVGDAEMVRDGESTIHPCRNHSAHFTSDLSVGQPDTSVDFPLGSVMRLLNFSSL